MKIHFILPAAALLGVQSLLAGASPLQVTVSSPRDYQVVQRASWSQGTVVIAGTIRGTNRLSPVADAVQVRVVGNSDGGRLPDAWQPVALDSAAFAFRKELVLPAGGWYRVEIRVSQAGEWVATNTVDHVGIGEVFVVAGQSNSANYGEEKQKTLTGLVSAFDGSVWQPAADPEPGAGGKKGSFMPVFGDAIVEHFHVPVGLVPMGIGSTSVREWLPSGILFSNPPTTGRNVVPAGPGEWESTGKIFTNFSARMKLFGPHGFRAVLWHQGESDGRQSKPGCTLPGPLYREFLADVIQDSRRDIGWDAPWFVAQVSYHNPNDVADPEIRDAQKALWDQGIALEGPDTDTLTGLMREKNGQGIHLSAAGLHAHGRMWADKVTPWLEQQKGNP